VGKPSSAFDFDRLEMEAAADEYKSGNGPAAQRSWPWDETLDDCQGYPSEKEPGIATRSSTLGIAVRARHSHHGKRLIYEQIERRP
jgi:hypothetical protein